MAMHNACNGRMMGSLGIHRQSTILKRVTSAQRHEDPINYHFEKELSRLLSKQDFGGSLRGFAVCKVQLLLAKPYTKHQLSRESALLSFQRLTSGASFLPPLHRATLLPQPRVWASHICLPRSSREMSHPFTLPHPSFCITDIPRAATCLQDLVPSRSRPQLPAPRSPLLQLGCPDVR
jgi:hypothetical protein